MIRNYDDQMDRQPQTDTQNPPTIKTIVCVPIHFGWDVDVNGPVPCVARLARQTLINTNDFWTNAKIVFSFYLPLQPSPLFFLCSFVLRLLWRVFFCFRLLVLFQSIRSTKNKKTWHDQPCVCVVNVLERNKSDGRAINFFFFIFKRHLLFEAHFRLQI